MRFFLRYNYKKVFLLVLLLIEINIVWSATIFVPADKSTIQTAINDSTNGDLIVVSQGHYYERINFNGKKITVQSSDPNDPNIVANTIIDANNTSSSANYKVVQFVNSEDANSVINGFTITKGYYGIYCTNTSPVIKNCKINNNGLRGIHSTFTVNKILQISNCQISGNNYQGIYLAGYSSSLIRGTLIINDCNISNNGQNGFDINYSNLVMNDSFIKANGFSGSQTYLQNGIRNYFGNLIINNSEISGNKNNGILNTYAKAEIFNCLINANKNGIQSQYSSSYFTSVSNSIISNHTNGAGIYFDNSFEKNVANCTITKNKYGMQGKFKNIKNSIIYGNTTNNLYSVSEAVITYSCIGGGYTGLGNINIDPSFIDSVNNDFHLDSDSVCIDAGEPWADYSNEPSPNGARINMGAYGNTIEAEATTDTDNDGICDNWETYYWPSDDPNKHDPNDNSDSDRFANFSEYLYGYNPTATTNELFKILYMSVDPVLFDPTQAQTASITYWANAACSSTVDINQTAENEIVRSISNATQLGLNQVIWDGKDNSGLICLDDNYDIKIDITDANSQDYTGLSVAIDYDCLINNVKVNPYRILPLFNELTTITFEMAPKEGAVISVFDPLGNLFWTTDVDSQDPNQVIWSGQNTSETGYIPMEGDYAIEVRYDGMRENNQATIRIYE